MSVWLKFEEHMATKIVLLGRRELELPFQIHKMDNEAFNNFLSVCVFCLHVCMYTMCIQSTEGIGFLGLELQMIMSHISVLEFESGFCTRAASGLNPRATSTSRNRTF